MAQVQSDQDVFWELFGDLAQQQPEEVEADPFAWSNWNSDDPFAAQPTVNAGDPQQRTDTAAKATKKKKKRKKSHRRADEPADDAPTMDEQEAEKETEQDAEQETHTSDHGNDDEQTTINVSTDMVGVPMDTTTPVDDVHILKVMYKKQLICTVIVTLFVAIVFIAGISNGFYTWRGISFNVLVLCGCCLGLYCGLYNDESSPQQPITKLKFLLVYFLIVSGCTVCCFGIALVYLVLIPLRVADDYQASLIFGICLFYFCAVLFWTLFATFYVDLIARSCLKRGRIGYTVVKLLNASANRDENKWFKIYCFVMKFRIRFRAVRRFFTQITGVRCIYDRHKREERKHAAKEHEEQRVLQILHEHDVDSEQFTSNIKSKCGGFCACLLLPFFLLYVCFIKCFEVLLELFADCGGDFSIGDRSYSCTWCVCGQICCVLILIYLFMPLFALSLLVLFFMIPFFCRWCGIDADDENFHVCFCIALVPGIGLWVYVWYYVICDDSEFNSDGWNWDNQCSMWNLLTYIVVQLLAD